MENVRKKCVLEGFQQALEHQERMITEGALDRIAVVDEVARAVDFFVGPLGTFVTGQVLRVDGGTQLYPA